MNHLILLRHLLPCISAGAVSVFCVLCTSLSGAEAPVILFQDDFENRAPGASPGVPPWTSVNSDAHPDHEAVIRRDLDGHFGKGTENQFLEFRDGSPTSGADTGSLRMMAINIFSEDVVTLSFRAVEPLDPGYTSQLTVQLFAGTGTRINDNRAQVLRLRNGEIPIDGEANVPYGYAVPRRFDFIVNNSGSMITYNGDYTLASGLADIWIDGRRAHAGYTFARGVFGDGPVRSIDFSTFSNHNQRIFLDDIVVYAGAVVSSPPAVDVTFPLKLRPNWEPYDLFGYDPEYTPNIPSFDSRNRPYIRSRGTDWDETSFVHTIEDGRWVKRDFIGAVQTAYPNFSNTIAGGGSLTERVVFDESDRAYMYLKIRLTTGVVRNILMMSEDYCRTWTVHELSDRGDMAMEHLVGHNRLEGPPFFLHQRRRVADHPSPWAAYHELRALQPRFENGSIFIPNSAHMNDRLISIGQHSGGSTFSVTRDGRTHFAWIEVVDDDMPEEELPPGAPTFVATYDHATRVIHPPVLVAYARPINNSHNRPGLVFDSEGYIHLVTGSHHGQNFYHARSLQPNDAYSGWTEPEAVWGSGWRAVNGEDRGGQTYVSLVCDPDDTLHLVFRHWRSFDEHFSASSSHYYGGLAYQRKPKGGVWSEPRLLVAPEREQYSIYYQKLAVDRVGRLFVSFSHFNWSMDESLALRYQKRLVILSDDGGDSWRLAQTADFDFESLENTYHGWRLRHFSPMEVTEESISGPAADPAGTGIANLARFALGLDRHAPVREAMPRATLEEGRLEMTFLRPENVAGIDYQVEVSSDLAEWSSASEVVAVSEEQAQEGMVLVRAMATPPAAGVQRQFLRLRLVQE